MTDQQGQPQDNSIAGLIGQLVDDAKSYVKSELAVYKANALHQLSGFGNAIAFAVIGIVLVLCAVFLLLLALVFALAAYIGMALASVIVAIFALGIAGLLFHFIYRIVQKRLLNEGSDDA